MMFSQPIFHQFHRFLDQDIPSAYPDRMMLSMGLNLSNFRHRMMLKKVVVKALLCLLTLFTFFAQEHFWG